MLFTVFVKPLFAVTIAKPEIAVQKYATICSKASLTLESAITTISSLHNIAGTLLYVVQKYSTKSSNNSVHVES